MSNEPITVIERGRRSMTTDGPVMENVAARGVTLFLNVYAAPAEGSLSIHVFAGDTPLAIWNGAIDHDTGQRVLMVYPGAGEQLDWAHTLAVCPLPLPRTWSARIWHSQPGEWEYALTGCYQV